MRLIQLLSSRLYAKLIRAASGTGDCAQSPRYVAVLLATSILSASAVADSGSMGDDQPAFTSVFNVYEDNRQKNIGNYITPDLALLTYSLMRQSSIVAMEENILVPVYSEFLRELSNVLSKADGAVGVKLNPQPTTLRNLQFVMLLRALLENRTLELDDPLYEEQQRVLKAESIAYSSFWGHRIDYSQFKPRGRYSETAQTQGYFRALRYASSVVFCVQPSASTGITAQTSQHMIAQAAQMVELITGNNRLSALRKQLELAMSTQFGRGEDISDSDWLKAEEQFNQIQAEQYDAGGFTEDSKASFLLQYAREKRLQPAIVAGLVDMQLLEPALSIPDVLTGWRLMPQRYTADAAFNQRLVYPQTGDFIGTVAQLPADESLVTKTTQTPFGLTTINARQVKGFPLALESAAALGNEHAMKQLRLGGEQSVEGYPQAFVDGQQLLSAAIGLESMHNMVVAEGSQSVPPGKEAARLSTLMAFQTWQRYLEVLYRKQSYTSTSKGIQISPPRKNADLESATGLYLALAAASRLQHQLSDLPFWTLFAKHCERLARLSQLREGGANLPPSDIRYLNKIDRLFLVLAGGRDQPIVVDVHTEPSSALAVQQGIGYPIVFQEQTLRGARTSFHEFKQPLADRLTDQSWMQRLSTHSAGGMP